MRNMVAKVQLLPSATKMEKTLESFLENSYHQRNKLLAIALAVQVPTFSPAQQMQTQ